MKQELDDKLCRDFPKLFKNRFEHPTRSNMYFGFEVGDGWEPLIRECAAKLEALNDKISDPIGHIVAAQVKEKFGTLSFYLESVPVEIYDEAYAVIREAEAKSGVTCEVCSGQGKTSGVRGWLHTLCETHKKEREERK